MWQYFKKRYSRFFLCINCKESLNWLSRIVILHQKRIEHHHVASLALFCLAHKIVTIRNPSFTDAIIAERFPGHLLQNQPSSVFWGWLSMEVKNSDFIIYPENFHTCCAKAPKQYVFTIAQPSLFFTANPKVFSIIWRFLGIYLFCHTVSNSFSYEEFS